MSHSHSPREIKQPSWTLLSTVWLPLVTNFHTFNQTFLVHMQQAQEAHCLHQEIVFQERPGFLTFLTTTMVHNNCKTPSSYFKASATPCPDGQQMFTPALLMLCLRLSTHSRAKHYALLCMHCPSLSACIPPFMHSSILLCTVCIIPPCL